MKFYLLWVTVLSIVIGCYGRQDGAPTSACSSLTPSHSGIAPQESSSPFTVSAMKSGNNVRVTISSPIGEQFEGFLLQPRSSSDRSKLIDGEFTMVDNEVSKTIDCFGSKKNTLTHPNPNPKKEVVAEWTPKEAVNEDIIFRATVAKTYNVFWTEIDSPLKMNDGAVDKDSNINPMYEGCFTGKGCFGLPTDCVRRTDCEVLLSYSKSPDGIHFGLQGFLESSRYMAMALSNDGKMGEDSVTECIRDGNSVTARESWNEGRSNTRTKELPNDGYHGLFTDGLTSCFWTTPYLTNSNGQSYDLANKNYFILLAKGEVSNGQLAYHTARLPSSTAINFTIFHDIEGEGVSTSVKIHDVDESTEFQHQPSTSEHEANSDSTNKISPSEASETTVDTNCSSHLSFSLFLIAIFGLFFPTEGYLFGNFGLI